MAKYRKKPVVIEAVDRDPWPPTTLVATVYEMDGGGLLATFFPNDAGDWLVNDPAVMVHADHWTDTNNHIKGLEAQVASLEESIRDLLKKDKEPVSDE